MSLVVTARLLTLPRFAQLCSTLSSVKLVGSQNGIGTITGTDVALQSPRCRPRLQVTGHDEGIPLSHGAVRR